MLETGKIANFVKFTAHEIERAMTCLLKLAQAESFKKEICDPRKERQVSRTSNLVSLNPFIDTVGVIRMGGRLISAPVPYQQPYQQHPVILSE